LFVCLSLSFFLICCIFFFLSIISYSSPSFFPCFSLVFLFFFFFIPSVSLFLPSSHFLLPFHFVFPLRRPNRKNIAALSSRHKGLHKDAHNYLSSQECYTFYGLHICHCSLSWTSVIQFTPLQFISLSITLTLSSQPCISLLSFLSKIFYINLHAILVSCYRFFSCHLFS
jgi:hypothetical protein